MYPFLINKNLLEVRCW